MREIDFEQMAMVEKNHWWFSSKRKLFIKLLKKNLKEKNPLIADVGCGTGEMICSIKEIGFFPLGFDENQTAIDYCKEKELLVYKENFFEKKQEIIFDVVFLLDVLEHIENDKDAINILFSRLKPSGFLFLNVPAFQFLYSNHDRVMGHYRRYIVKETRKLLERAGFEIVQIGYWNFFLFTPITIYRTIGRFLKIKSKNSEVGKVFYPINFLLKILLKIELFLISKGISFPIGTSIYCIAQKK